MISVFTYVEMTAKLSSLYHGYITASHTAFLDRKMSFLSRTDSTQESIISKEESEAQKQVYIIHGRLKAMKRKHKRFLSHFERWKEQGISSCIFSLLVCYLRLTYSGSRQKVLVINARLVFARPRFSLHWCLLQSFNNLWGKSTFLWCTNVNWNPRYESGQCTPCRPGLK